MRTGDKRFTDKEKELIIRLYGAGLSFSEIGRRFNRDHSSILYQIEQARIYNPKRQLLPHEKQRKFDMNPLKKEIEKEAEEEKKKEVRLEEVKFDLCVSCRRLKEDPKWKLTNFCSLKCWNDKSYETVGKT